MRAITYKNEGQVDVELQRELIKVICNKKISLRAFVEPLKCTRYSHVQDAKRGRYILDKVQYTELKKHLNALRQQLLALSAEDHLLHHLRDFLHSHPVVKATVFFDNDAALYKHGRRCKISESYYRKRIDIFLQETELSEISS